MNGSAVLSARVIGSRVFCGALVLGATLVGSFSRGAQESLPNPPQTKPKASMRVPTPPQSYQPQSSTPRRAPARATPAQAPGAQPASPQSAAAEEPRSGGIIERSFYYHRQQPTAGTCQPMRSAIEMGGIPQANGYYNYGFPVQSYRYGWFGAEPHGNQVFWTKGYYDEEIRAAYRRAY